MSRLPFAVPLAGLCLLSACSSVAPIVGVLSGAVAGGATANPAVGFAVGVAVDAAADIGIKKFGRDRQRAEQDEIAAVAGGLALGAQADWRIEHTLPLGNEHGEVRVSEVIDTPIATCRAILFSVQDDPALPGRPYAASICRQGDRWKWASAEPAVERWGNLQ